MRHFPSRLRAEVSAYFASVGLISPNARLYLLAAALMAAAMGIQLVLYNLYLTELGYREDVVGQVAAAVALGVALGGIPAGLFYDRFGGRAAFRLSFLVSAVSAALRALAVQPTWLVIWAVVNGLSNSLLFVSIFPFITEQSTPAERPHLYGMNQAVWSGLMVVGSFVSGYLPGLWRAFVPAWNVAQSQQVTLLLAAGLGVFAFVPISYLKRLPPEARVERRTGLLPDRGSWPVMLSSALILALTGLVIGLTQPFYNVYFKNVFGLETASIGTLISLSQLTGLLSALMVPIAVRKLGLVYGPIMALLLASPLAVIMGLPGALAVIVIAFLLRGALEWLATTPIQNLIMESVSPKDRGAMSGVRLITNYGAQALAGAVGGWLVVTAGYAWLFAVVAGIQLVAAGSIWMLFRSHHTEPVAPAPTLEA